MNKQLLVVVLVIIALGLVYYYITLEEPVVPPVDDDSAQDQTGDDGEEPIVTTQDIFLDNLLNSEEVYIVMDSRNVSNQTILEGILQCGVDLAGSPGLADKNITALSLEEDMCWGLENATIEECLAATEGIPTLYITTEEQSEYFENKLIISINEEYVYGSCKINVVEAEN